MDFEQEYKKKLISADEAAKLVKDGDLVQFGFTENTPFAFDRALAKRTDELHDVNLYGGILGHVPDVLKREDAKEHFTWNSVHMSGIERKLVSNDTAFYMPIKYSELPRYYRENIGHMNVCVLMTTPMDKHGYFNFGISASHLMAAIEISDVVIVEVNKNMPRCLGGFETDVNIKDVDYIIESDDALDVIPAAGEPSDVDKKVAEMIVNEIPNGACLQLGIGGMPNAVGKMIAESDLKDLGVHTEMYVDAFVDLTEAGKITGAHKNIDRYRQTYAFASGSQKLYDFLDDNPSCMAAPVNYTNDMYNIAKIDNFISINNAINIDLYGQVGAETAGMRQISGAGGQLDFVIGAYLSKGGKSFICLSSTFKDKHTGELKSRILPTLDNGTVVTDTRANTMYIVTEYGMVNLKGMTTWQRAEALIGIAHPDLRDELIADAEKAHIWRKSNKR